MTFENINIRNIVPTALSENAIMIDIRAPERFYQGHIPMSVNLPFERIKSGHVTLPKSRTLIVYCDTGNTSMQAARLLSSMGYHVINCVGGIRSYRGSLTRGS